MLSHTNIFTNAMAAFPGVRFGQAFGMTEASPILTILPPSRRSRA